MAPLDEWNQGWNAAQETLADTRALKPYYTDGLVTLYQGDCRELLPYVLPDAPQVWLTDPPYSSGGFQEAGKPAGSIGTTQQADRIIGDTLSTRGYMNLLRDVLRHSQQAVEIGVFTDWRMWTNTTDALEYAGFMLRAMVVWKKPAAGIGRPWRNQHELVAYGMRMASDKDRIARRLCRVERWLDRRAGRLYERWEDDPDRRRREQESWRA